MKQVLIQKGQALLADIPAPCVEAGTVLVRVDHSCISIGTEMSGVRASGIPLWKRALKEPENVKKAMQMVAAQGFKRAHSEIRSRTTAVRPSGYSAAGVVLEIGAGVTDLAVGDRVACAGSEYAFHAEVIRVPRNLTVPIPDELSFAEASTVTLGAIALQGVRRAQPTLGETFVVVGLGAIGQLTIQLLKANGCRVIGMDLESERVQLGLELGMDVGIHPGVDDAVTKTARLTDGFGVDGVIITAATPSDEVVSIAFKMCRKKGRVVLVGDVGLDLNRGDLYAKELDFLISTSYGPGRYEQRYEEEGLDYPIGYVRWTENRNMVEYLRLLAEAKLKVGPCIDVVYPLADAREAYEALADQERRPFMVLLRYADVADGQALGRRIDNIRAHPSSTDRTRIAVVGAGSYAKLMHLPFLQSLSSRYHLQAIVSRTGHNAKAAAEQYGANYATTEYEQVLKDPAIDAVLITTRHDLHAPMVLAALKAGKHVLVEKPLALTQDELVEIQQFFLDIDDDASIPVLMTGFNRRFSSHMRQIRELVRDRTNPMILNYRMNAGYIPLDHWVHSKEGGGRNRGEACHVYDAFLYLVDHDIESVDAIAIKPTTGHYSRTDNFVATIRFQDGSVATLTYTALGATAYPKEKLDIFCDGKVISLDDYSCLDVVGFGDWHLDGRKEDKGQKEELIAFSEVLQKGGEWPISLRHQIRATEIANLIEVCLQ